MNKTIEITQEKIEDANFLPHDKNDTSWSDGLGILLTTNQAEELLQLLQFAHIVIFADGKTQAEINRAKAAFRNAFDNER